MTSKAAWRVRHLFITHAHAVKGISVNALFQVLCRHIEAAGNLRRLVVRQMQIWIFSTVASLNKLSKNTTHTSVIFISLFIYIYYFSQFVWNSFFNHCCCTLVFFSKNIKPKKKKREKRMTDLERKRGWSITWWTDGGWGGSWFSSSPSTQTRTQTGDGLINTCPSHVRWSCDRYWFGQTEDETAAEIVQSQPHFYRSLFPPQNFKIKG